jgi:hypothetical protein
MDYNNPWTHNETVVTDQDADGNTGFVYLITNTTNDKKYVGKKLFQFSKTKTVKGKKKRSKVASDWKEYYGSNGELQQDVENLGADKFKREILYICKTKGECSYLEAYEQFMRRVLLRDDYYNSFVGCRIHAKHLPKEMKGVDIS